MQLSGVDQAQVVVAYLVEIVLIGVLIVRREYRRYPIFLASLVLSLIDDPILFWLAQSHRQDSVTYQSAYTLSNLLDYTLQIGILVEVAHAVLHPSRKYLSRASSVGLAFILTIFLAMSLYWSMHYRHGANGFSGVFERLVQVNFAFSFLRLAIFAAIAGFSQMLGVTWRNHVIRLAGGLAFYSAISLIVQLTTSHLSRENRATFISDYYLLQRTQVTAYLLTLSFWVWSFVQKEAHRREFTPQMQQFLVTMSETARRSRLGFARSLGQK